MTLAFAPPASDSSPLADWDARWKLTALLLLAIVVASLNHLGPLLAALTTAVLLAWLAHISWGRTLERLALLALGIVPFVILLPLTSTHGWSLAWPMALRGVTIGLLAVVLVDTTPMTRLVEALHALGLPDRLVWVMQLAFHYVYVLFTEVRRIRLAARTRGFRIRTNSHTYRTLGHMAGAILVRSGDRAEQVAAAMRCRGFDGRVRTLVPFQTRRRDIVRFAILTGVAMLLLVWGPITKLVSDQPH